MSIDEATVHWLKWPMAGNPAWLWIAASTLFLAVLAARALESCLAFGVPRAIGSVARSQNAEFLRFDWRLLALPALGGLISGLVVTFLCRPMKAHGTAILIDAFHNQGGRLALRDAVFKALAAVAVISLGGSVGKEAVVAVLCAAIGSALADARGMSRRNRRVLLVAGCGAGVGAIFKCPLGGALFACTVLYREPDIEADGLMPSIVASVTAYSVFVSIGGLGHRLLTGTGSLAFSRPAELPAYLILGLACACVGVLFSLSIRGVSFLSRSLRLPRSLAPMAAGLLVGVVACAVPQVMDSRYEFVQNSLDHAWLGTRIPLSKWAALFAAVALAKVAATSLMIGTDTAGGLFGPVVFMGGIVGAATGAGLAAALPGAFPETLREAMIPVGMAGLLSSSLRVPLAAIVMVMEMTGSYGLIVPLMLTSVVAYAVGRRWGVYPEQVSGLEASPAHAGESLVNRLDTLRVADFVRTPWTHVVGPADTIASILNRLPPGPAPLLAVVREGSLFGVIAARELLSFASLPLPPSLVVAADVADPRAAAVDLSDDLYRALEVIRASGVEAVPVVSGEARRFEGMIGRSEIVRALREGSSREREAMLEEHAGLSALEQEARVEHLLLGLPDSAAVVDRVSVPPEATGKSLRECDFRRRYGGQVLAVLTGSGVVLAPPDPARELLPDDVLLIVRERKGP